MCVRASVAALDESLRAHALGVGYVVTRALLEWRAGPVGRGQRWEGL